MARSHQRSTMHQERDDRRDSRIGCEVCGRPVAAMVSSGVYVNSRNDIRCRDCVPKGAEGAGWVFVAGV